MNRLRTTLPTLAAVGLFLLWVAPAALADCDPGFDSGTIALTGGTLNGAALNIDPPQLLLTGGGALQGTVDIHVTNGGGEGDIYPVCATPSWGDHASSGWTIDGWLHNPPGAADYSVPLDLNVPSTPGTYYVFFASAWELDCGNVLSCTNWAYGGGDLWNDGRDVADWTDAQAQAAMEQGWACSEWVGSGGDVHERPVPAAALRIVVPNNVGNCDPDFEGGSVAILGGLLNGTALSPSSPTVTVSANMPIQGELSMHAENTGGTSDIFPVCGTPNWGDHASSGWTVDSWLHNPPGTADYSVPVDLTAPEQPGVYYLFFAGAWELNCGNVLSCTNWGYAGGNLWNDGHDVADWSGAQAQDAMDRGWVCSEWIGSGGDLHERPVPAAAVRIVVEEGTGVAATSWSAIKSYYR